MNEHEEEHVERQRAEILDKTQVDNEGRPTVADFDMLASRAAGFLLACFIKKVTAQRNRLGSPRAYASSAQMAHMFFEALLSSMRIDF